VNPQLPDLALPWPIGRTALALIAIREGCHLTAYLCPAGRYTCGWGQTGPDIHEGTTWTQEYADQRLLQTLTGLAREVREACTVAPNQNQLGAMVSLAYNIGMGWKGTKKPAGAKDGFRQSTVLRQHNAGNFDAAAGAFKLWNKAGGKVLSGLTSRRLAEAALYAQPLRGAAPAPMPQEVDAESKLTASPIAQAGGATVATGAISVFGVFADQVAVLKGYVATVKGFIVDTVGIPADAVLPVLLIVAGGVVIYWRWRQRQEGFA
jgi:lysozyme